MYTNFILVNLPSAQCNPLRIISLYKLNKSIEQTHPCSTYPLQAAYVLFILDGLQIDGISYEFEGKGARKKNNEGGNLDNKR